MHRQFLLVAWLVIFGLAARAQNPVPPVPAPGPQDAPNISVHAPNADVQDVLTQYQQLTGKTLIWDATLQGKIDIRMTERVTPAAAIQIIESVLLLNNFVLVPGEGNLVKVIGLGKNAKSSGLPLYTDIADLPANERVVTFLFKLQYADAQELAGLLQAGYLAPGAGVAYSGILAVPKASALLVTESTTIIRTLEQLIQQLDVPPAGVIDEFIPKEGLQRADAKDVLEKLTKMFETQPSASGAVSGGAAPRVVRTAPPVPGEAPNPAVAPVPGGGNTSVEISGGTLSEDSIIVGKIKLTADVRTNRIHVVTRPINLPFLRKLIHDFDADVPFGEPTKRALLNIRAEEVLDVIVKAITEPGAKEGETGGTTGTTPNRNPNQPNIGGGTSFGGNSNGTGGVNFQEELQTQPVDTTPKAVTVGNTKIIADPRENTIIVLGNGEVKQKIFALLDQIDVVSPQVYLETIIGELTLSDSQEIGFSYFLNNGDFGSLSGSNGVIGGSTGSRGGVGINSTTGRPFLDFPSIINAQNISNLAPALAGGAGGLQGFVAAGNSLGAIVNALASTGRFHVTQHPKVFASNNRKAVIASGSEIAVPTTTQSTVVDSNTINNNNLALNSNIGYKNVVVQLEVVPLINAKRQVSLDIVQKVDDVSGSTTIGGNQVPNVSTRKLQSYVTVADRETVVLGGLVRTSTETSDGGIPYLSKVPVLNYFFKNTRKVKERRELIVMIRPQVTSTPEEVLLRSDTEQKRLLIEPDISATIGPPPRAEPVVKMRGQTTIGPGLK